jgi:excisionase family DNA binding protein
MKNNHQAPQDDLVRLEQAAAILDCSLSHVRRLVIKEKIPRVRVGRLVKFRRSDLLASVS